MFLLVDGTQGQAQRARAALGALERAMGLSAETHELQLDGYTLLWAATDALQNLHRFRDGVVLGLLAATEAPSATVIDHEADLPDAHLDLFPSIVVRTVGGLSVEPIGIATAFTHGRTVSDRQLLVAAMGGLRPSPASVAVLAGLGFFPGNLSLFDGVERIPFLHQWSSASCSSRRTRDLVLPRPDDLALVDRLASTIPTEVPHAIGLSGGLDSRFSLGVMLRAGADVRIVRFTDDESGLVGDIASTLGLEVASPGVFFDEGSERPAKEFTLRTDALIWSGLTQHSRLAEHLAPLEVFQSGQFSDSIIKNAFKTAWKDPDPRGEFWDKLVDRALVPLHENEPDLRAFSTRVETRETIHAAVAYQRGYLDLGKRKQQANWLYYMNRGLRWAQPFYQEMSPERRAVFLMSDIDAQLLGISTGFWDNFHNDRAKRLNQTLLPTVTTPYTGDEALKPGRGLSGAYGKIEYEFVKRFKVRRSSQKRQANNNGVKAISQLPAIEPDGWADLFTTPMGTPFEGAKFGMRRVQLTVAYVLEFLQTAATDIASAAAEDGRPQTSASPSTLREGP